MTCQPFKVAIRSGIFNALPGKALLGSDLFFGFQPLRGRHNRTVAR